MNIINFWWFYSTLSCANIIHEFLLVAREPIGVVGVSLGVVKDTAGPNASGSSNLGLILRTGDSVGVVCNCIISL